jgi:MFS family permease
MASHHQGTRWANIDRALRSPNYRLFFFGQSISLIGTWMQRTALLWLVSTYYHDARSAAFWLGVVGFCNQIPAIVLTPITGVFADRWNRHNMVIITQILAMIQALVLAGLTLSGHIQMWQIVSLALCLGAINAVDVPTRQAFVVDMMDRHEDLDNAIALNSTIVNGGRMIGPALGGIMIALFGAGYCFLINGLSYIAVLISLLLMRIKPRQITPTKKRILSQLAEGFHYALGFAPIRGLLFIRALISLVGIPYTALLPVFASHLLGGGPKSYGLLVTGVGVGALCSGLYLASRSSVLGLGRIIAFAATTMGTGMILLSLSRSFILSLMITPLMGTGQMLVLAATNTVLQTIVDDDKRGRVMSLNALAFMGMVPIGSLMAGTIASHIGPAATIAIGGSICILGGLVFGKSLPGLSKQVQPIYVAKGISKG